MREIGIDEFKSRALAVLRQMKSVCEKNNIRFFLAYGTAIGAVRHQGFIPWDDDIDVVMFREDYERFQHIMNNERGRYQLLDINSNRNYALPLAKLIDTHTVVSQVSQKENIKLGVWVDVFVLDFVPDDIRKRKKLYSRLEHLQTYWTQSAYNKHSILKWGNNSFRSYLFYFLYAPIRLLGARFWVQKIEKLSKNSNTKPSSTVAVLTFAANNNRERHTYPVSFWGNGKEMLFEGDYYLLPEKNDEYLKFQYGDYMQLPPEEQRVFHHTFTAFAID